MNAHRQTIAALALALGSSVATGTSYAGEPVKRTLDERAVQLPDNEITTLVRTVEWPVGYRSAEHSHDGPGPRYVLSGIVEITEGGVAERYAAGESFWHSGELPHTAENVDSVPTTVLIVELLPKK